MDCRTAACLECRIKNLSANRGNVATFDKAYFDNLPGEISFYLREFPIGPAPIVTIRLIGGREEFNIHRILKADDELLTFTYYDSKKQTNLPDRIREERGERQAFPAITLRYCDIHWIEFNPGDPDGGVGKIGFQFDQQWDAVVKRTA